MPCVLTKEALADVSPDTFPVDGVLFTDTVRTTDLNIWGHNVINVEKNAQNK